MANEYHSVPNYKDDFNLVLMYKQSLHFRIPSVSNTLVPGTMVGHKVLLLLLESPHASYRASANKKVGV